MKLKNIFQKPVDRPIEGVIKADDAASLRLEVEEYVLTNEIEKRLESFLDAYNNYEGANGVWISGFFGSGKSHLLKILALLIGNRDVEGIPILDIFIPKCGDNKILQADLKRAVAIPSLSILFNIDQKADVISKSQIDALLAVFVKVFDESCGYYGKQPYIAQFERELDQDKLFNNFKKSFKELSSHDWEWGRMRAKRMASYIDSAYNTVTKQDVSGILDKYRTDYRLSIEDFAQQVNRYIESKGTDFRLNFFVDEVGQYVANNIKLMTNLQTIAESLATKSRGRAWIIVTAQEDMNSVVGEMDRQQSNDFSKIQARFANRMKLTSADVAEVIQKRLLQKNNDGIPILSDIYNEQSNNFKTLFDFADGSQLYRNFQDCDHFIHSYPFIPYQFTLFQSAIQTLSLHNAFEGKHSSVGERSMLGVFQQVAIQISDHHLGQLATFDLMFEGIRTALKSQTQKVITVAEKNLDNTFAVRLLKALYLVKYVKEFKATIRNICVLMHESFEQDLQELKNNVEEALNLLEQQTYIQRNGEYYEYLTDEEKDVEQEIKNTEVDTTDVANELAKIIFDYVIKNRKIRFLENKQDYQFSRKLDDRFHGREYELSIHVISPFYENAENKFALQAQTMGSAELMIVMPSDDRLIRDILMYKRTEKYINLNITTTQQDAIKRIITDKRFQNNERYAELQAHIQKLLSKAIVYVSGTEIELKTEDAQTRISRGFQDLIRRVYPNLNMLRGISYTENDIAKCLKYSEGGLFGANAVALEESEQEVFALIQSNNREGIRTTLKSLIEKFERKPYGWFYAAILCTLAKLHARGKIELKNDSNPIENSAVEQALRNTRLHGNIILEPQIDFTPSQLRNIKEFFEDFFDSPPQSTEAKAIGNEIGDSLKNMIKQISPFVSQSDRFPFLSTLNPVLETLKDLSEKSNTWYLTELVRQEDTLMDMKEGILDPVRLFMNGPQKEIYESAMNFIQSQEPNFTYIESDELDNIKKILNDPDCFKGNRIQQMKSQVASLKQKIVDQTRLEITKAKERTETLKKRLQTMDEFNALSDDKQQQILNPIDTLNKSLENQSLIAVIRDTIHRFEEEEYKRLLDQIYSWREQKTDVPIISEGKSKFKIMEPVYEPKVENIKSIQVPFDKACLANMVDIDNYLFAMKKILIKEIENGKRIQV